MAARLADTFDARVDDVLTGIGLDPRIGNRYLKPGPPHWKH